MVGIILLRVWWYPHIIEPYLSVPAQEINPVISVSCYSWTVDAETRRRFCEYYWMRGVRSSYFLIISLQGEFLPLASPSSSQYDINRERGKEAI
jgi:hypothetical protein